MKDHSTTRHSAGVGSTTLQGDPLTVAVHQVGERRHVALRWPYAAPYSVEDIPAEALDGIDVTAGEALALGVLLVRAHEEIERGTNATTRAAGRAEAIVGRVRFNRRPGSSDVLGVRIRRNTGGAAAIGVHVHRDDLAAGAPRVMWLPLRDARVFAEVLDMVGADRAALLVRRAIALATNATTDGGGTDR